MGAEREAQHSWASGKGFDGAGSQVRVKQSSWCFTTFIEDNACCHPVASQL